MLMQRIEQPTGSLPAIVHRPELKIDCIPPVIPLSESAAGGQ